jgi:hypothetical protein
MPTDVASSHDASAMLEKLTAEERDYILFRLVSDKVDERQPTAKVPIYRPDGALFGFIHPAEPPSSDDVALMLNRARRVDPSTGRPTRDLLERMKAGDEAGVRSYLKLPQP